jgi:N-acetyl-gamma-glutamyl-phosphate reductase
MTASTQTEAIQPESAQIEATQLEAAQTAVVGVGGYSGMELARLLLRHPRLNGKPPVFAGRSSAGPADSAPNAPTPLASIHPRLMDNNGAASLFVEPFSWELFDSRNVEVLFLATPHEQSRQWVPEALERGIRVIDLSGAWRLNQAANRAVYKFEDEGTAAAAAVQAESVYGMPELHRDEIPAARLVANPGCYATSIILALKPLLDRGWIDLDCGIVADSKSGVSGAGKAPTAKTHFMHAADNLSAYGLFGHRHNGELLEQLQLSPSQIVFTPHLLPIPRGILSTIYLRFREKTDPEQIQSCFDRFFATSPMVRVFRHGELPQIQYSAYTNFCDIGFQLAPDGQRCVLVSCLDNLLKGAAGQAVQNMNLMCGWPEAEGLI